MIDPGHCFIFVFMWMLNLIMSTLEIMDSTLSPRSWKVFLGEGFT